MGIAQTASGGGGGVAFLVSAGIVYEIVAACCSSPQTAEINAKSRAPTLMKWVHLGVGQAAVFVLAAALFDRKRCRPILGGGVLAGGLLYGQYRHAMSAGLADGQQGTEGGA